MVGTGKKSWEDRSHQGVVESPHLKRFIEHQGAFSSTPSLSSPLTQRFGRRVLPQNAELDVGLHQRPTFHARFGGDQLCSVKHGPERNHPKTESSHVMSVKIGDQ